MSGGAVCHCGKRSAWRVHDYRCNHSAFNGYRWTPSDYSSICCEPSLGGCGVWWRTKAAYVDRLPHYRR
jgi:hypothetical protein